MAGAVLGQLWERRAERAAGADRDRRGAQRLPGDPPDALTALATEYAVRIAAEGRKFGLYLLVVARSGRRRCRRTSSRSATTSC